MSSQQRDVEARQRVGLGQSQPATTTSTTSSSVSRNESPQERQQQQQQRDASIVREGTAFSVGLVKPTIAPDGSIAQLATQGDGSASETPSRDHADYAREVAKDIIGRVSTRWSRPLGRSSCATMVMTDGGIESVLSCTKNHLVVCAEELVASSILPASAVEFATLSYTVRTGTLTCAVDNHKIKSSVVPVPLEHEQDGSCSRKRPAPGARCDGETSLPSKRARVTAVMMPGNIKISCDFQKGNKLDAEDAVRSIAADVTAMACASGPIGKLSFCAYSAADAAALVKDSREYVWDKNTPPQCVVICEGISTVVGVMLGGSCPGSPHVAWRSSNAQASARWIMDKPSFDCAAKALVYPLCRRSV